LLLPLPLPLPFSVVAEFRRRHFAEFHQRSPFQAPSLEDREATRDGDCDHNDGGGGGDDRDDVGDRFPVKAFAQMCLGERSGTLRLESHVVETLVLGSTDTCVDAGPSFVAGSGGGDLAALHGARRDSLEAICEFHGVDGWTWVDRGGLVVNGVGVDKAETSATWQEAVWDWYDARF